VDKVIQQLARREAVLVQSIAMVTEPEAAAPLVVHLDDLARQTRSLRLERTQVLTRQRVWQEQQANVEALEDWCRTVSTRLDSFGFKERRMVLDALGFSATLFCNDHEPRYIIAADLDPQLVSSTT
jgi:hypothetical protein